MKALQISFLRFMGTRLRWVIALYIAVVVAVILLGAIIISIDQRSVQTSDRSWADFRAMLYVSSANYLGLDYGGISTHGSLAHIVAFVQGWSAILLNGCLIAVVVYKLLRVERSHFIFSNYVLLTNDHLGRSRIEVRVYNDSDIDIVNLTIKLRLNHRLATFPNTVSRRMYRIVLNYDDYVHLPPDQFLTVSSQPPSSNSAATSNERDIHVVESTFDDFRDFQILLLVQGEFLKSGVQFSQLATYEPDQVRRGYWRYILKEDLDIDGRLPVNNFNAFDVQPRSGQRTELVDDQKMINELPDSAPSS